VDKKFINRRFLQIFSIDNFDQATPSFFEIAEQQQSLFNPRPAQGATKNGKLKADV